MKLLPEKFIDALKNDLGEDGDLLLGIFCKKCDAHFEIGHEAAALAILTDVKFLEYLRAVQSSKCPHCNECKAALH